MKDIVLYTIVTIAAILVVGGVVAYSIYVHRQTYGHWIWELPPQDGTQPYSYAVATPQEQRELLEFNMRHEMNATRVETNLINSFFKKEDYSTQEIDDDGAETGDTEELLDTVAVVPGKEIVLGGYFMARHPFSAQTITDTLGETAKKHPVLDMDILTRNHLMIAGIQGNGKTQTQIRFMVEDIRRGAQVWWMTPHLALYNEEDQPTDLRPIEKHFRQVFEYDQIGMQLRAFAAESTRRLPFYRRNEPVGETIVVYLDEWPGIVQVLGDEVTEALQTIAREGRKCRVFLVLASQDALVKTLGIESGVREQFNTRLVGRVDQFSWTALVGKGFPRYKPSKPGEWTYAGGWDDPQVVQIGLTPASTIEEIAKTEPKVFTNIDVEFIPQGMISTNNDDVVLALRVAELLKTEPNISNRKIARTLWPESGDGGGRWSQRADVLKAQVEQAVTLLPVTPPVETTVPELPDASVTP